MSSVLTIENFDATLRGTKILQYILKGCQDAPLYEIAAAGGEPFSRSILIAPSRAVGAQQFFRTAWDAVFQVRAAVNQQTANSYNGTQSQQASQDWSFILTYITNSPKPVCIFVEDGIDPPDAFIKKLPQTATLIVQKTIGQRPSSLYDTIYFPPISEANSHEANIILSCLDILLASKNEDRRSWLKELRVAGAGIVWTRFEERSQQGAVYWYDPTDTDVAVNKLPVSVVASHLKVLAGMLSA
jgi:hypothetical protein